MENMNSKLNRRLLTTEEQSVKRNELELAISDLEKQIQEIDVLYVERFKKEKDKKRPNLKAINKIEKKKNHLNVILQKTKIDLIHVNDGTYLKMNFFQKIKKTIDGLTFKQQEAIGGMILALPWLIGFIIFFAIPLIKTIYWSFNNVTSVAGGLTITWNGINNYVNLFTTQTLGTKLFLEVLWSSISEMLIDIPVIFIFSLLVAVMLNSKFKGHQFFRLIFFIPVIYNSTVINLALNGSFGTSVSDTLTSVSTMLNNIQSFLLNMGMGEELMKFLISAVDRIFTIVTKSGIQILMFLAALQSIPSHLYEAAKIEGATEYDAFCKITVPMVSKMFLPVIIYTIVDSFANSELITIMTKNSTGAKISYGVSSAIAVIYFIVNLLIIGIIYLFLKKVVQNNE